VAKEQELRARIHDPEQQLAVEDGRLLNLIVPGPSGRWLRASAAVTGAGPVISDPRTATSGLRLTERECIAGDRIYNRHEEQCEIAPAPAAGLELLLRASTLTLAVLQWLSC